MKKKEFAVGEVLQFGLKKLKVVEVDADDEQSCKKCAFAYSYCGTLDDFTGSCFGTLRSDKTDVIFVEAEEEQ